MLIIFNSILFLLLFVAAWQDYRNFRIKNELVFSGALLGILLNTYLPSGLGFMPAFTGWCIGLLLFLPFYALRIMGAGDVKLMGMVGAFVGFEAIVTVCLYVLIAGGVLSLSVAWHKGVLRRLFQNILAYIQALVFYRLGSKQDKPAWQGSIAESNIKLPYGVAIAAGTIAYFVESSS